MRRILQPNPTLDLSFLNTRNIIVLALSVFAFRFVHLATIILVPGFLANIHQYRPLETGRALAWVAMPMFAVVWLVAVIVIYTHSRLILALGLSTVAFGCWIFAHLDTSWAGNSFEIVELLFACGFACSFIGLIGSLVLEGLEAGVLQAPPRRLPIQDSFTSFVYSAARSASLLWPTSSRYGRNFIPTCWGSMWKRGAGSAMNECEC